MMVSNLRIMLIGPADIIVKSWKLLRANVRLYSEYVAWFIVLGVLQWTVNTVLHASIDEKDARSLTVLLAYIPFIVASVVLFLAMLLNTAKIIQGKPTYFREGLYDGFHHFFHFAWVWLLTSLVMVGGFLLFIIPAFVFFVWFKFSTQYAVVDGVHGVEALKKSKALVRGRWWPTFFRALLPGLFFSVLVSLAASLINLVIGAFLGDPGLFFGNISNPENIPASIQLLSVVLSRALNGFVAPLFIASELILWYSLKETPQPQQA